MKKKIKLLLLSGGSLVGRNILDSLNQRRSFFELVAMNSVAREPSLFEFDKVFLSPSLVEKPEEFLELFSQVVLQEKPDLVIPCRDEDVAFLSKIALDQLFPFCLFLCGPSSIAHAFLDKWASWKFSKELDLPFAPTLCMDASDESLHDFLGLAGFPLIAKPKKGFGSLGVFLITEKSQLKHLRNRGDYIIQKYLGNPQSVTNYLAGLEDRGVPLFHTFEETKLSIQGSIGPNGEIGGLIITEHTMKQGISARVDFCKDELLYQLARNWVEKIALAGWVGPINIQCQRDPDGQIMIYEFNGRFTGATSARFFLGFDELGLILLLWLGVNLQNIQGETPQNSVLRIPSSKPINLSFANELAEFGVWNRQTEVILKKQESTP